MQPPHRLFFYHRLAKDLFRPTKLTIGPWTDEAQHGGPPSSLLAHVLREHAAESESGNHHAFHLAKLGVTLYRPIPTRAAPAHRVTVNAIHATRGTRHLQATLSDAESGKVFARAEGLLIRRAVGAADAVLEAVEEVGRRADRERETVLASFPARGDVGEMVVKPGGTGDGLESFLHVMQCRIVDGRGFFGVGKAAYENARGPIVWYVKPSKEVAGLFVDERDGSEKRFDLVDRAIAFGDASSGASGVLPWAKYIYSNIDYTINFYREPDSALLNEKDEWVGFSSRTRVNPQGTGVAVSQLFDRDGIFATTTQNLVVRSLK
ncbi:thioesterase-like superfamily-domain-containing protein [Chytriomyces sp. MP71]|nr:thioesterase-like superfamily-domain-containing protein [Chytriomyces sp. MP71]